MRGIKKPQVYRTASIDVGGARHLRVVDEAPAQQVITVTPKGSPLLSDVDVARAMDIANKMARYLPGLHAQPWSNTDVLLVARALQQVYAQHEGPPIVGFEE